MTSGGGPTSPTGWIAADQFLHIRLLAAEIEQIIDPRFKSLR